VVCYFNVYLSRDEHDRKIRSRKQRTDIGKYLFLRRTTWLWNQLPESSAVVGSGKENKITQSFRLKG
jgi:hypothetical protein